MPNNTGKINKTYFIGREDNLIKSGGCVNTVNK